MSDEEIAKIKSLGVKVGADGATVLHDTDDKHDENAEDDSEAENEIKAEN